MADMRDVFEGWRRPVANMGYWRDIVEGEPERIEGFGDIYRMPNLAGRYAESLAIVDMCEVGFVEPRRNVGSLAIYCALEGFAHMGIGHKDTRLRRGDVAFIPPGTAHFMATNRFVAAVITAPKLVSEQVSLVDPCHPAGNFDKSLYRHIAHGLPLQLSA